MCALGAHTTVTPVLARRACRPTTLHVQTDVLTADARLGTQTCTRANGRHAQSQSASRAHMQRGLHGHRGKERNFQDEYSRQLPPAHTSPTMETPSTGPTPAGHTCRDSTPFLFTLPRLPSPTHSQSLPHASLNARRPCTHAHGRHGLTVLSSPSLLTDTTLSLPALGEGANSPGRMVRG